MKFTVDESVLDLFPDVLIAIVQGAIVAVEPDQQRTIETMRSEAFDSLRMQSLDTATLSEHSHVAAWRSAYQKFRVKAKTHKPTHEALARRLLKGDAWPEINPIVDIYLTNQISSLLPHGGYDLNTLNGDLRLEVSSGGERFEPLGGGEELTNAGELVYRDDERIITRRWNHRDCDITKITRDTKRFFLMIESPSKDIQEEAVLGAANELTTRYKRCYAGNFDVRIVRPTRNQRTFEC